MSAVPACRVVTVHLFRGDRGAIGQRIRKQLDDQKHGRGPGPTPQECLLYAGHTGVAVDSKPNVVWGFNPDGGNNPLWRVMQRLANGDAYPGVVSDDSQVFAAAAHNKIPILTFDVVLPQPAFLAFEGRLRAERRQSQFTYGFPSGDGDCNCATWLERLSLPLISGKMDEFAAMTAASQYPRRKFGTCV